jgi:hypothetical protein
MTAMDGRLSHAASSGEHQDVFAPLEPRPRHQHVPRGHERQGKRRRPHEIDVVGKGDQILNRHLDEFRIPAGVVAKAEHLVARAFVVAAREARHAASAAHAGLQHHPAAHGDVGCRR